MLQGHGIPLGSRRDPVGPRGPAQTDSFVYFEDGGHSEGGDRAMGEAQELVVSVCAQDPVMTSYWYIHTYIYIYIHKYIYVHIYVYHYMYIYI